jgi:glc operon protein GlcG
MSVTSRLAFRIALATSLALLASASLTHAEAALPTKPVLTLAAARRVAHAAEAEAQRRGLGVVVAVMDDSGTLVVLERLDDTQLASVDVAIAKARTAAIFRRPSGVFEDQVKNGRVAALALPGAAALRGGVPLTHQGRVIGSVGVSGDSPTVDEEIASAGAKALGAE